MQTGFRSPPKTTDNPPGQKKKNLEWSRAGQLEWAFLLLLPLLLLPSFSFLHNIHTHKKMTLAPNPTNILIPYSVTPPVKALWVFIFFFFFFFLVCLYFFSLFCASVPVSGERVWISWRERGGRKKKAPRRKKKELSVALRCSPRSPLA